MSATSLIYKYPLDLTGKSPTNLVVDEPHTLGEDSDRAFVTTSGPFFTESVVVKVAGSGTVLTPGEQYLVLQPYQEASVKSGLEVASIIYVTDKTIGSDVLVTYQVIGGEFSWVTYALKQMLEELNLDERPVQWNDIIGKPSHFPPSPHLHDLGDTYGWEYVAWQLEGIRSAILIGDAASHDELRQQFAALMGDLEGLIAQVQNNLNVHENDKLNPHEVTKAQVGLGLVENLQLANDAEALAGTLKSRYLTPFGSSLLANRVAAEQVATHNNNKNNPHAVTKTQVGLGNVDNYLTSTQAQAEAGTINTVFMTPLRVAQAIQVKVGTQLTNHINNTANPHQVTKAQVGLGSVENLPLANNAEATAGTVDNRYLTPAGGSLLATRIATERVTAHSTLKSNPHAVTKAQVGLGNVDNFLTASQAQAVAGSLNTVFMTPIRVAQAIEAQAGVKVDAHIARVDNPHAVTKVQVGLGSVDNFATASTVEAQNGTANNRFMTPLLTAQAIATQVGSSLTSHINDVNNPHQTTAAQVGAYSTAQTDNLLNQRLPVGGTAVNANALQGSNLAQVLAAAYAQVGSMGKRNVFVSTADPSAATGAIGDVWFKY